MNDTPLVSVIVPIFNRADLLELCIQTVREQTYNHLEILLVDDGSWIESPEMCDRSALEDERVCVIHKRNGGLSAARNSALDIMQGEYVSFVDSDDFLHGDMISFLVNTAREYEADIATCGSVDTKEHVLKEIVQEPLSVKLFTPREALQTKEYATTVMHKLYSREIFRSLRFRVNMLYEDAEIRIPLLWNSHRIAVTNQRYYFYYLSPNSIMRAAFSARRLDVFKCYESHIAFLHEQGEPELEEQEKVKYYFRIARIWYEMCIHHWKQRRDTLPLILAKERELRPLAVKSRFFTRKMFFQRIAYRRFPYLTQFYMRTK